MVRFLAFAAVALAALSTSSAETTIIGNCTADVTASAYTAHGQLNYDGDAVDLTPASDGSSGKKGHACCHTNSEYAGEDAVRDLFGPVTEWPTGCETSTIKLGAWRDNSWNNTYAVHYDCSCNVEDIVLSQQCTLKGAGCLKFATIDDVTYKVPSYKGYAFPTDQQPCGGDHPTLCGVSCADSSDGSWYDPVDAVTYAVQKLMYVRPDLAPYCTAAALEAVANPELLEGKSELESWVIKSFAEKAHLID